MKRKYSIIINILIILISVLFTYAVVRSAAENSCLEIKEQYFDFITEIIAQKLETGIDAGIDINNYYGIDEIVENPALQDGDHMKVIVLNEKNKPVAANFELTAEKLADVFMIDHKHETEFADVNGNRVLSQPFAAKNGIGHIVLIYDKKYYSYIDTRHPVSYYKTTVSNISSLVLNNIAADVKALYDKGLRPDDILDMEDYFNEKFSDFGLIDRINMGYDTKGISVFKCSEGEFNINMDIDQDYVNKTYIHILLSLMAAFIICIMIVIEFLPVRKIINSEAYKYQKENSYFPTYIRFISFFVYLAVYTSLPYGAIIINSRGESIFGLPVSLCASLPISLEAVFLLLTLSISPVIFKKTSIKRYTLLIGLCTVIPAFICFVFSNIYTIIICSIFLGITQGLLKYLMNYLASICSETPEDISVNYGQFNIGILTGITVGGSLGSITAAAKGYTYVYMATAFIMLIITIAALIYMPYEHIKQNRYKQGSEDRYSYSGFFLVFLKTPSLLINTIFSVGVVAVALMYIIAFMPVALDVKGLSPMVSTYGFLIYGIAGNYISGFLLNKARVLSRKTAAIISMLIIAAAVLVIIPDINAITITVASFLAGLFDGFGSPSVTSALLNIRKAKKLDSSLMLTGTALIGGIGNAIAPVIYSTVLYSGNLNINLCLLFAFFLFSGIYIFRMK